MGSSSEIPTSLGGHGGMMGRLANCRTMLRSDMFGGDKRDTLRRQLVELQHGLVDAAQKLKNSGDQSAVRAWFNDTKDIIYDLENLFEDIELEEMTHTQSVELTEFLQAQKIDVERLRSFYGFPPIPSMEDRVVDVLHRLDALWEDMRSLNLGSSSSSYSVSGSSSVSGSLIYRGGCQGNNIQQGSVHIGTAAVVSGFRELLIDNSVEDLLSMDLKYLTYYRLPWYLQQCVNFCAILFRSDHWFEKDIMVLLWIAVGFVQPVVGKTPEDVGIGYFNALLRGSFIGLSDPSHESSSPLYKVSDGFLYSARQSSSHGTEFFMFEGVKCSIPERVRHASMDCGAYNPSLDALSKSTGLLSLLLVGGRNASCINKVVPHNLFLGLPFLRVLDLSHSGLKEVPYHVCKLVHLRYLDLSYTRIKTLPELLPNLFRLLTLRLCCCHLTKFPKDFHRMVNVRHLDLYLLHRLVSMPLNIGKLTSLQTLTQFIVIKESGCRIGELGELNDLRRQLYIMKLENVESLEEAKQARLHLKQGLESLSLHWSSNQLQVNYDIIQGLQPHHNMRKLEIANYTGRELPSWLSDHSFTKLESICLRKCIIDQLPHLGQLPSLKSLELYDIDGVKQIPDEFYGVGSTTEMVGFPSLLTLKISGMPDLEVWDHIPRGVLSVLQDLSVACCQKLKSLPTMMNLSQLRKLKLFDCPLLQSLPRGRLPTTVKSLRISQCLNLQVKCQNEKSAEWKKISHIPLQDIDEF